MGIETPQLVGKCEFSRALHGRVIGSRTRGDALAPGRGLTVGDLVISAFMRPLVLRD